jgi:hypothetical protein
MALKTHFLGKNPEIHTHTHTYIIIIIIIRNFNTFSTENNNETNARRDDICLSKFQQNTSAITVLLFKFPICDASTTPVVK